MLHPWEVPVHRKIHVSANREKKLVLVVGLPQTTITSEKSASSLFVATFFAITFSNFMKTMGSFGSMVTSYVKLMFEKPIFSIKLFWAFDHIQTESKYHRLFSKFYLLYSQSIWTHRIRGLSLS